MKKPSVLKYLVTLLPCLMMGTAQAGSVISEVEPNDSIAAPQYLVSASDVSVKAFLGNGGQNDLDYYKFYANAGDVLTIDIDNGYDDSDPSTSVDTIIAIFDDTAVHKRLRWSEYTYTLDPGSTSLLDPRIENFTAPESGYYYVGVSNVPRYFNLLGGTVTNFYASAHGSYTLVITGATNDVKQVAIQIKPSQNYLTPINPRSRGKIPVAVLGGPDFNVSSIDTTTLTFGSTGDEASLSKCNPTPVDLNGDGYLDLLCHFDNQAAKFKFTDIEATLRGETTGGIQFEGRGDLKVVPLKQIAQ